MTKHLLVTGGAGFIGSAFVALAVAKGDKVIVLDALTYAGHRENLTWLPEGSYRLVEGNICDEALVLRLLKEHTIDALVHFAAESHVDNSINGPEIFIQTNIFGTFRLLEATRDYLSGLDEKKRQQFRYIQVSTDEIYGALELESDDKFSETTAIRPNSPYSASKAAGDLLARAWWKTYGIPTITTNCSNNYGPRQFPEKLIPHMITRALMEQSLPVYGDGKNIRDWIHVEDHVRGVYLALERGMPGETYCFGGNAEVPNIELVKSLCEILGNLRPRDGDKSYHDLIKFVPDRPGHDRRYAIDDRKAERELGFSREFQIESGLQKTVEWYLANGEWCRAVTQKAKAA